MYGQLIIWTATINGNTLDTHQNEQYVQNIWRSQPPVFLFNFHTGTSIWGHAFNTGTQLSKNVAWQLSSSFTYFGNDTRILHRKTDLPAKKYMAAYCLAKYSSSIIEVNTFTCVEQPYFIWQPEKVLPPRLIAEV